MPDPQAQPRFDDPAPDFKAQNKARKSVKGRKRSNHGRPKTALGGRAHQDAKASAARLRTGGLTGASDNTKARFKAGWQRMRAIQNGD